MKILRLVRVPYGKESTPEESREYWTEGTRGPCGTISEWKKFAAENGFEAVDVVENFFVISPEQVAKFAEEAQ